MCDLGSLTFIVHCSFFSGEFNQEGIGYLLAMCRNYYSIAVTQFEVAFDEVYQENGLKVSGADIVTKLKRALQLSTIKFRSRKPNSVLQLIIKEQYDVEKIMLDVQCLEMTSKHWQSKLDEKLLDKAFDSVKIMERLARKLGMSVLEKKMRSTFYDVDKGGLQQINQTDFITVKQENLSYAQRKMSQFASWFVHDFKPRSVTPPSKKRARSVTPPSNKQTRTNTPASKKRAWTATPSSKK